MKYDNIFEQIAKKNNVSKQQVIKEIEKSMTVAMNNPLYKDKWDKIKNGRQEITVDDFLDWILKEVNKTRN